MKYKAERQVEDKIEQPVEVKADQPVEDKPNHNVKDEEQHPVEVKADQLPVEDKADHVVKEKEDQSAKAVDLPEDARAILKSLASEWDNIQDVDAMQVIPLKGAMTNKVVQIKWPTNNGEPSRKVIVRIYGEGVENFFDRDDEIRAFECLSKNEQGPRLLGRFSNGRVEEFIRARVIL